MDSNSSSLSIPAPLTTPAPLPGSTLTSAPLPGATSIPALAPAPLSGLAPAPLPGLAPAPPPLGPPPFAPIPGLLPGATLPGLAPAPLPGLAPPPLFGLAPAPLYGLAPPPLPGLASPPLSGLAPPPIPIYEPQSFDIKDENQMNAFLSQSFATNKIDQDEAEYIGHSEYHRYLYQQPIRRHYHKFRRNAEENKTRKYALPFLKQYKLPNTLISKEELQPSSLSNVHPLSAQALPIAAPIPIPAPAPTAAPLSMPPPLPMTVPLSMPPPLPSMLPPLPMPPTFSMAPPLLGAISKHVPKIKAMKKVITCPMDKIMYFQFCDVTIDHVKQNEDDQEEYTIVEIFDFDDKKRNMMIIGSLSPDIGVVLNKEVCEGLEKNVSDYMYPQRNRQIVIEIQNQKGRETRSMHWEWNKLTNKTKLIDKSFMNENEIQEKLKELMVIKDHNEMFSQYKVRIHDLVDPSLLKFNYNLTNDQRKGIDDTDDKEKELMNNWIPAIFHKNKDGNIEIVSEINNLSRLKYPKLYKIAAGIFKKMLASFEWITGYNFDNENINNFKVIVKMMNYEIMAGYGDEYTSMLHREGHQDENIIAVGIYYYYISDKIVKDRLRIEYEWKLNDNVNNWRRNRRSYIEQKINVKENNFIVFNNGMGYQHQLKELLSGNKQYIVKRKIFAFFLVDPKVSKSKLEDIIVVNLEDKIDLITMNWSRQCVINNMLSVDVVKLISMFTLDHAKQYYLNRDMKKMNAFIQDAENQYKNRPKPRKCN